MHDLGFISDVTKRLRRNKKLVYTGKVIKGRVSPLKCLLSVVMSIRRTDIIAVKNMLKVDSQLKLFEAKKVFPAENMRLFQRVVSLAVFDKLGEDSYSRKRLSAPESSFLEANMNKVVKYAKLVKKERTLREEFIHNIGLIPLDSKFTKN